MPVSDIAVFTANRTTPYNGVDIFELKIRHNLPSTWLSARSSPTFHAYPVIMLRGHCRCVNDNASQKFGKPCCWSRHRRYCTFLCQKVREIRDQSHRFTHSSFSIWLPEMKCCALKRFFYRYVQKSSISDGSSYRLSAASHSGISSLIVFSNSFRSSCSIKPFPSKKA